MITYLFNEISQSLSTNVQRKNKNINCVNVLCIVELYRQSYIGPKFYNSLPQDVKIPNCLVVSR